MRISRFLAKCQRELTVNQARRHVVKSGPAEVRASGEGTSEGESTRVGIPPSRKGVFGGISPVKFFYLWLPLCALPTDMFFDLE